MSISRNAYGIVKKVYNIPYKTPGGHAFRPIRATFELTYRCNLKCEMCYLVHEGREKKIKELTPGEIKNVVSQLTRKIPITFTGGEPFVKEGIMDILRYTSKRNNCGILTNGIMLTENRAKEIVDMGISAITISIDGTKDVHDKIRGTKTFKGAIQGIRNVQEYKNKSGKKNPNVHLNTVILPFNIGSLDEIIDLASELSIHTCSFQILDPSIDRSGLNLSNKISKYMEPTIDMVNSIDPSKMKKFLDNVNKRSEKTGVNVKFVPTMNNEDLINYYSKKISLEKYTCKLPWSSIRISPFGDVYPCFNYKIGNVKEKPISELWNNFYYKTFRKTLKRHGIFPGCVGCCNMIYR
jgi:MoaA/NifB/PqqE/SkfB family radical SAM enzyme